MSITGIITTYLRVRLLVIRGFLDIYLGERFPKILTSKHSGTYFPVAESDYKCHLTKRC